MEFSKLSTDCIYRTIIKGNRTNRIGIGILNKSQHKDYQEATLKSYSLIYVINGTGKFKDHNDQTHELKSGSLFQRIPGKKHSNWVTPNDRWTEAYIDLGEDFYGALESYNFCTMSSAVGYIGFDKALVQRFVNLKKSFSMALDHDLQFHFLELLNLFTYIMKIYSQKDTSDQNQKIIEAACLWLSDNNNYNKSIETLCEINNWGYEKFRKLFHKKMNLSPGKYRIIRRMERACQYLQREDKSIQEIAFLLGYPNAFDFSNQFKKTYKTSPSKFKKG